MASIRPLPAVQLPAACFITLETAKCSRLPLSAAQPTAFSAPATLAPPRAALQGSVAWSLEAAVFIQCGPLLTVALRMHAPPIPPAISQITWPPAAAGVAGAETARCCCVHCTRCLVRSRTKCPEFIFIDVSGWCNRPQRMHCKQGWCRCLAVVQLTSDAYQRMKSANRALNTPITTSSCICGVPMRTGCCTGGAATTVTENPRRARCAALRFAAVASPDSAPAPGQPPSDHGLRCGPGRLFLIAACGLHQPARRARAAFERF